jgi:NosR/NirI family nitrous oxide reductase transcriptional regulator
MQGFLGHLSRLVLLALLALAALPPSAVAGGRLPELLAKAQPGEIVPGADAFGPPQGDPPVVAVLKAGRTVAHAFLTCDVVDATGYSGKPICIVVGLDDHAHITGAKLVDHHEPIVLIGIPVRRVEKFINGYVGRNVLDETLLTRTPVDIVSGATVSMMVIADSMMRASIRIAHRLGLGGAAPPAASASTGPRRVIDSAHVGVKSWLELLGDGSVRRLLVTNHEIDEAFRRSGNEAAIARPQSGPPDAPFVDLYVALVSVPTIGRSLLGEAEWQNLRKRLKPGEQAVLIAGNGPYSFRGSGYVRGGIFDRIEIIQGENTIRFRDRNYERIGSLAPQGAPDFPEIGLFITPDNMPLDAAASWRLQLLVQRATGAMDKAFITLGVTYLTPDEYLVAGASPSSPAVAAKPAASPAAEAAPPADAPLWQKVWRARIVDIAVLLAAIGLLTGIFFFQDVLVKRPAFYLRLRLGFLAFTLFWIGWYEHAQLSVVNVFTFLNALRGQFRWDYFLMDPLVFILWCSVAAALLFWGRGAYCGWLCPFGALQEWSNRIARFCRVPQLKIPFGVHQRLWPIKYIVFLGLFGVSLGSVSLAEELAEIEPFKTAIILHFMRDWWFVALALALLAPGLAIERFYCRYLCPLGGALAVPARIRMFDWLRRYRECGSPCQRCANECPVAAIHPEGHINPNECIQCLNCQVLYHHDRKCPVMIQKRIKREKRVALSSASMRPGASPSKKTLESAESGD